MALFGTQRDAKFLASINAELLNAIVDTEIEFFKLVVEQSNSNIYGESTSKSYFNSILIPALITKEGKTSNMDDYGHSYTRTAQFGISRDILVKADFYPESGDIVKWDNEFYELDNVDANEYFAGKNPETWPNGDKFGYSVSVLCDAHVTRQTPTNIRKMRFGSPNDDNSYKGFG
tara:strand:- start:1768 stop:2292 length:525 start_codon:yes stop_codon:yes gene_type:complete